MNLVLSCEHGGNRVPPRYRADFDGADEELASHAGWDPGAALLARQLARATGAPLTLATTTRLLVELNRSHRHRSLFSAYTRHHGPAERARILERYYHPHREAVEAAVTGSPSGPVLHVSVHSFTPVWDGRERGIDVALLYDPKRERERSFAGAWLAAIAAEDPGLRLARNRPYRGNADGLTTFLRRRFAPERYLGLELEVSQGIVEGPAREWSALRRLLARSLCAAVRSDPAP